MEEFKKAIKRAAEIRELSYISNSKYSKTIEEAADKAAEEFGFDLQATKPIHLLLTNSWNEVLEWADS